MCCKCLNEYSWSSYIIQSKNLKTPYTHKLASSEIVYIYTDISAGIHKYTYLH